MTEKDFAGKLAASLRRARQSAPAAPAADAPLAAGSPSRVVSRARFARQSDQSPPASLDRPWDNLHPERIWPD
jgi:hypothetical protein